MVTIKHNWKNYKCSSQTALPAERVVVVAGLIIQPSLSKIYPSAPTLSGNLRATVEPGTSTNTGYVQRVWETAFCFGTDLKPFLSADWHSERMLAEQWWDWKDVPAKPYRQQDVQSEGTPVQAGLQRYHQWWWGTEWCFTYSFSLSTQLLDFLKIMWVYVMNNRASY